MSTALCCWCAAPLVKLSGHWWCGNADDTCRVRQAKHGQFTTDGRGRLKEWLYVPLPKQAVWHEAVYDPAVTRFLIGGAAGPGKSICIRRILYEFAKGLVPGFHALLLRKSIPDLKKSHLRFLPHEVGQLGGRWYEGDKMAVFPHKGQMDAIIRAGHFEDASAMDDYLSAEFDVIAPDEIVTFPRDTILELFTRCRSTNEALYALRGLLIAATTPEEQDEDLDGSFVLGGTNPGGQLWVRDNWITKAPDLEEFPNYNPARWMFYDAKLRDNPYIKSGYVKNLRDMREARRRQLEDGDWDVFEGMFFSEWQQQRMGKPYHVATLADLAA